jgi:DNA-binding transcriptional LysR family regulator
METRRLEMLLELSRLGSMRAVADALGTTTSSVSQQLAALATEARTGLLEPDGRRVRLTPAGRRLAEHAVTILAAVEAARVDLDPRAEPSGTVRVGASASAIRRTLLPIVTRLAAEHPGVRVLVREHEPTEAFALLDSDELDLALTYDYNLAPATPDRTLRVVPLWSARWGLGVPDPPPGGRLQVEPAGGALQVMRAFADADWIANSRNTADEDVVRTLAAMAGFAPRLAHRADSLDLVQDFILAGLGVGLLPCDRPARPGVRVLPLIGPDVWLHAYAVTRRGREGWPPLALVLGLLAA